MFRLALAFLGAGAAALILATGAPSRASDLTKPVLLQPGVNQSFTLGTPIAFQVQTIPGDSALWLHVSKSPSIVDSRGGGVIDDDVELEPFAATVNSSVYEAKPTYFKGGWMDTPGTYYWQAYRIEYGGGADGRVVSEIRSFTIKNPPTRPLASARLQGTFKLTLTVRATSGIKSVKRGRSYSERWTFTPRCAVGACDTKVTVSSLYSTLGGWSLRLKRSGIKYKKSQTAKILQCFYKPARGPLGVNVRATKGGWIDSKWRATRITGTFKHSVRSMESGVYHCPAGTIKAALRGTLSE